MPKIVRLYITHVLIGFLIAVAFVAMLLWFNIANLWHLVSHSADGIWAVLLLWVFNGLVFASVQFAIAVMLMARDGDGSSGGTRLRIRPLEGHLIPIKVANNTRAKTPRAR